MKTTSHLPLHTQPRSATFFTRVALLLLLSSASVFAELHLWTDTKGRQITATFVSLVNSTVTLETTSGSRHSFPLSALIAADQAYALSLAGGGPVSQKPVVTPWTMPDSRIGQRISHAIVGSNSPTSYTVTGLPPGVLLDSKTGVISGAPTAFQTSGGVPAPFVLKVSASNSAGTSEPVTVNWVILPPPGIPTGTFSGLVDRHEALNHNLGGSFKINTTNTGAFSGSLTFGTQSHSFKGALTITETGDCATASANISRKSPLASLTISLEIDLTTGELTGNVEDASSDLAALSAIRSQWSNAVKATAYAGKYNAAALPESMAGIPQGSSFMTLNVSTSGTGTWAGKMADGSTLTGSTVIGSDGQASLYAPMKLGPASVQGWTIIDSGSGNLDGSVSLLKHPEAATSKTRSYKNGILAHNLTVLGGRYASPASLVTLLGLGTTANNASLQFVDGGLSDGFSQDLTISTSNGIKLPSAALNPNAVTLTLSATTGLFSGSFTQPGATRTTPRKASMLGVVVPRLGQGLGFFLLPEPANPPSTTATTSPLLSGTVALGGR